MQYNATPQAVHILLQDETPTVKSGALFEEAVTLLQRLVVIAQYLVQCLQIPWRLRHFDVDMMLQGLRCIFGDPVNRTEIVDEISNIL
jgi:hypothetical protein